MFSILTVVPIPRAFTILLPQTNMPYSVPSLKSNILMPLWFTMHEAKIPNSSALTLSFFFFFHLLTTNDIPGLGHDTDKIV